MKVVSHYRPQRSWGKVIFSQASVILSTGGSASVHAGIPLPPTRHHASGDQADNPPPDHACTSPEQSMLGDMVSERAVGILLECNLVTK